MTQSKEHNNSPDTDPEEREVCYLTKKKLPTENNIPGKPVIQNRKKNKYFSRLRKSSAPLGLPNKKY